MKNVEDKVLELFNALVVDKTLETINFDGIASGYLCNFKPTRSQESLLKQACGKLAIKTLFGRVERETSSDFQLITKQIMHYIEVYGLDSPGLFNLEVDGGEIYTLRYIRGISVIELGDMVRKLAYSNAPVKDAVVVRDIVNFYNVDLDINEVKNNELRVVLFDEKTHVFDNGDDAVRYMCYKASGSALLIKSKEVIDSIRGAKLPDAFFARHERQLATVFNRHKRIIMAAKNKTTRTSINRITRLSKTLHVPIIEGINKRFVAESMKSSNFDFSVLDKIPVRDKFKILNLLEYKRQQHNIDAFVIRNGKIHVEHGRKTFNLDRIDQVVSEVVLSLSRDLAHLRDKKIVLDKNVDYGLPVSRKQAVGHLPYGTTVTVGAKRISSGIYWENDWGARDLDLSTIDSKGNRTGWGQYSGYDRKNPVTFSGDVTSAPNGGMEFMTSSGADYGLFVNIYSGATGATAEVVVGSDSKGKWIEDVKVREKITLGSRGNIIGFVKDDKFVMFQGRMNNSYMSGNKDAAVVARGSAKFWTVRELFDLIGVEYFLDTSVDVEYDHDMRYEGISYDKLEDLLLSS